MSGRKPKYSNPKRPKVTLNGSEYDKLDALARAEGRSVPELLARIVAEFLSERSVSVTLDADLLETLRAIAHADPRGRLSLEQMVTRAIENYAKDRGTTPEVQEYLIETKGTPLRLHVPNAESNAERPTRSRG
jgi:hypothetical protein